MSCNCNKSCHKIETVVSNGTNVILTVTNSNNISSLDCFNFSAGCKCVSDTVTGSPLPVLITVNGTNVALENKYGLPILSNRVPCRSRGSYVVNNLYSDYGSKIKDPELLLDMAVMYLEDDDYPGEASERAYKNAKKRIKYFENK